jgi:hypothetical protein
MKTYLQAVSDEPITKSQAVKQIKLMCSQIPDKAQRKFVMAEMRKQIKNMVFAKGNE